MDCEKIKELILTDYIDNEMNDKEMIRLNIHFSRCRGCKDFFEAVNNTAVKPFAETKKIEPPEYIWHRVKEAIIAERREKPGFAAGVLQKLNSVFYIPRSALTLSTIMAMILIIAVMATLRLSNKQTLGTNNNREEQTEYSIYSMEVPVSALLNNNGGFGTSVEEFFL